MYARRLTKEELIKDGITRVTEDGHVFRGDNEAIPTQDKKTRYFLHSIYDLDENGNKIKVPRANSAFGYVYKQRSIGLHRLMWAWFHDEVQSGMIVDHLNNHHDELKDYDLSNLQLVTPRDNLAKERPNWNTRLVSCMLNKPRSYYEEKLAQLILKHDAAKEAKDTELCHKLRTQVSQYRAKLRYWDEHKEEALQYLAILETTGQVKEEKRVKRQLLKKLREYATYAKSTGAYRTWHMLNSVINNKDSYTNEQVEKLIKDMEAWMMEAGGLV